MRIVCIMIALVKQYELVSALALNSGIRILCIENSFSCG